MMCDSDVIRIELETKVHEESLLKPNCPYLMIFASVFKFHIYLMLVSCLCLKCESASRHFQLDCRVKSSRRVVSSS